MSIVAIRHDLTAGAGVVFCLILNMKRLSTWVVFLAVLFMHLICEDELGNMQAAQNGKQRNNHPMNIKS
jgi:hypothetical protein